MATPNPKPRHDMKKEFSDRGDAKTKVSHENSITGLENFKRIIRDGAYGYIFWSVFQALAPMIWFYPLNELEISGYEAFCVTWLSPIFCVIPRVFNLLQNKWVLIFLRLMTVGSILSFQASTTLLRLIILSGGAGIAMLVLTATLWSPVKAVRYRTFWGLIVGLHAFLASRVCFTTFVPTWWDNYSNSVVLACGVVSSLGYALEEPSHSEYVSPTTKNTSHSHWLPCGIGFGSLLYLTHMCFGEASLVSRWTVKGYPDPGPVPLPWGSLILMNLVIGTVLFQRKIIPLLTTLAATCCLFLMLLYPNPYLAYMAGCFLAYFTMSLWPVVVDVVTQSNPGACLALASLTYIIQCLFWVWTVAYNFVPYGEYTREHTDWLVAIVMGGILFLVLFTKSGGKDSFTAYYTVKTDTCVPTFGSYVKVILLIFLVSQAGMFKRFIKYKPGHQEKMCPKVFTAGIWTYHFGYDNKGWPSMERAASMINDTGADIITLLESDASKPFLGNNDLAGWLAERLNFYVDFGPSTKDHTWGNLILSKYPIVKSVHHLLPSPYGELAPAITASINISGTIVDFVVTHMGNDRDVLDRKLQSEFLARELKNSQNPALFLGYVTSSPGSSNYNHLLREGKMKDIDPTDKERWCEYIMYKKLIRLGYARISHGGLSDTEVQIGTFRIPEDPENYVDNSKMTIHPEKHGIDKNILYNAKFGNYYSGHGYFENHGFHMGTPKYFYND